MLYVRSFAFNPLAENTYVLYDDTRQAVIIDPGCYTKSEQQALRDFIAAENLTVTLLLNTHGHVDHVLGNDWVKDTYGVRLLLHRLDEPVLKAVPTYAALYGFPNYREASIDGYLEAGETVRFGETALAVLFVPGHSPGHVAFYNEAQKLVIGGDVLFYRSIGRTDLPGGDHDTLIRSIRTVLLPLADEVIVYPGHGDSTTIGEERRFNPFLQR